MRSLKQLQKPELIRSSSRCKEDEVKTLHKKTSAHLVDSLLVEINFTRSATVFDVLFSPTMCYIKSLKYT